MYIVVVDIRRYQGSDDKTMLTFLISFFVSHCLEDFSELN